MLRVIEMTHVTHMIEQVKRRKSTWAGHFGRIQDNRWILHITTWKSYEGKRFTGRPTIETIGSDELDE